MRQSPTHAISQRDSRGPVPAHSATVAAPEAARVRGDGARDVAVGVEQRVAHSERASTRRRSSAACSLRHQLPARPRRHRAAADAVGDDVDRRRPVERAVRILVDGMAPAAARRDRELELHAARAQDSALRRRRAIAGRGFAIAASAARVA